jgi:hypothetical protein
LSLSNCLFTENFAVEFAQAGGSEFQAF